MTLKSVLSGVVLTVVGLTASVAEAAVDQKALAVQVVEKHLIPGFQVLEEKAAAQEAAWDTYCAAPSEAGLTDLKDKFKAVSLAWMGVQFYDFGPVTLLMRKDRLYHWPERRNAVGRALSGWLAKPDMEKLEPHTFSRTSVALQGLPALERLLYEQSDKLVSQKAACALGSTIAGNIATITKGSVDGWYGDGGALEALKTKGAHPIYFEAPEEVLGRSLTGLLTGLQMVRDQKILPALGPTLKKARPKKAEAWRSGLTMPNIQANLLSVAALTEVMAADLPAAEKQKLLKVINDTNVLAMQLSKKSMEELVYDEKLGRPRLTLLLDYVKDWDALVRDLFVNNLGLSIGFNSLDGD